MRNDDREISKEDFEWLRSAIKDEWFRQIIHISDEAAIATDGMRLHVINVNRLPDKFDGFTRDDVIEKTSGEVKAGFLINPEYLADALKGFSQYVRIEIVGDNTFWSVKLSDDDSDKIAFIACMKEEIDDDESD
jgi:hypothetical protein